MNWLHTWAGVVLGGLLFAIFWMGTLSVFDREIDRWMMPTTRLAPADEPASFDALHPTIEAAAAAHSSFWYAALPTDREPMMRVGWRDASGQVERYLDPRTGAALPDPGTWAGTRFIYPFHYMLHIRLWQMGRWIVGGAALAMLALCVSGVVIHRKVFTDFFTFRSDRNPRRLILDLHNVTGVLGLPFHVAITLSGLILFFLTYFSVVMQVAYRDDRQAFSREAFGIFSRPKSTEPGGTASLEAIVNKARRLWGEGPRYVFVTHPGDAAAYVNVYGSDEKDVSFAAPAASFDATTGALLRQSTVEQPVMKAYTVIGGFHLIRFRHWTLRWLYFALGLSGTVLIATGYLFWLESRRKKHAQLGLRGVRLVEGLTVGSVTGIMIATLAFFVANRLLPLGASVAGYDRAALEIWAFYLVWLASFGHAWLRPRRAWIEQCGAIAVLAVAAVLLNWITTGDDLARSLSHRHLWPVAGMDLLLLAGAAVAAAAATGLGRRSVVPR